MLLKGKITFGRENIYNHRGANSGCWFLVVFLAINLAWGELEFTIHCWEDKLLISNYFPSPILVITFYTNRLYCRCFI